MSSIHELINQFYDSNCTIMLSNMPPKDKIKWVDHHINKPILHDPDYIIFKHFKEPTALTLDIGANWGYSVTSMLAAGCASRIHSFEPLACYVPHLSRLKERLPKRYDFRQCGLGAENARLRFVTPVLNDDPLTGYTSASESAHRLHLRNNLEWEVKQRKLERIELTFIVSEAQVYRLDDIAGEFANIRVMKIDTEGHEPLVIAGGIKTIAEHRPLLMIEGANRVAGVAKPLAEAGYLFAERDNEQLRLSSRISKEVNGFFVHPSRMEEYQALGLLAEQ